MGIAENIKKLRSIYGVTQEELARVAGVTENAVSKWENGYANPRMGAIERIAACYRISKSNIIEDGGMDSIDPATGKPRPPIRYPEGALFPSETKPAYAPLLGRVHAGDAQEPDILDESVPIPHEVRERHPHGYFLKVEGDCMDRVYPEGCHIYIDPDRPPQNGSVAVVSIDGADYVMRRLYRGASTVVLSPESHDPSYDDIVITADTEHTVEYVGTVVWYQPEEELE